MRIVVCGDSFNDRDERFPGLHWADRLQPHEVYRLAKQGASNFSIWHQIQQSARLDPKVVLINFTTCPRIEYITTGPKSFPISNESWLVRAAKNNSLLARLIGKVNNHDNENYHELERQIRNDVAMIFHVSPSSQKDLFESWAENFYIEPFEILKNYIFILNALDHLDKQGITSYVSLGGFEKFLDKEVRNVKIQFDAHKDKLVLPNPTKYLKCDSPVFHIADSDWHAEHARLVTELIGKIHD